MKLFELHWIKYIVSEEEEEEDEEEESRPDSVAVETNFNFPEFIQR